MLLQDLSARKGCDYVLLRNSWSMFISVVKVLK